MNYEMQLWKNTQTDGHTKKGYCFDFMKFSCVDNRNSEEKVHNDIFGYL